VLFGYSPISFFSVLVLVSLTRGVELYRVYLALIVCYNVAMEQSPVLLPLILSFVAGISTGIGSLISLFIKRNTGRRLAVFLGFSAGVMVYISFVELFFVSMKSIGLVQANIYFFLGITGMILVDFLIPHNYIAEKMKINGSDKRMVSVSLLTLAGIMIHNFPEGLAVVVASTGGTKLALIFAFAIAIHNIPEGIAVAVPIYNLTGSKRKAFFYSLLSGLTEPVGAIVGVLLLWPFLNQYVFSVLFAFIAGVMVFISFDELLPMCYENDKGHAALLGVVLGMLTMAVSLSLL